MARSLVFACGGSGGHIFPALATGEEIRRRDPEKRLLYVCGKKDFEHAIFKVARNERVVSVDCAPFSRVLPFGPLRFLIKSTAGFFQSLSLLRRERPELVMGFGGYTSFPVLMAARCLGLPTLLHEQNVVPGKANRWMAGRVDAVALSFPGTAGYLPNARRTVVTGNPIRSSVERECREEALKYFGFSPEKKTLLVLGGSQGAESINTLFLQALPRLSGAAKKGLQVLHLCGRMDPRDSERRCAAEGVYARAYSFFDAMDLAYGAADLCVGRAGATFLAEVRTKRLPVLLVPYPFADGHQWANAEAFRGETSVRVEDQKTLGAEKMAGILEEMMREASAGLRPAPAGARPNAREALADCIEARLKER